MSLNIGARAVAELAGAHRSRRPATRPDRRRRPSSRACIARLLATLDAARSPDGAPGAREAQAAALAIRQAACCRTWTRPPSAASSRLVYQPQVDRDGETVLGVEALLRWTHPTRGGISPALFIPLAERHGLIRPITGWVLDRADGRDRRPRRAAPSASTPRPLEFADPGFVDERRRVIVARTASTRAGWRSRSPRPPSSPTARRCAATWTGCTAMGVKIALDDFGVGYSSLSHLRLLSVRQAEDRPGVRHRLQPATSSRPPWSTPWSRSAGRWA